MITIILDHRPIYLSSAPPVVSLLTLPMGSSALLDRIMSRIVQEVDGEIWVVPTFSISDAYVKSIQSCSAFGEKVVEHGEALRQLSHAQAGEQALFVESSLWFTSEWNVGRALDRFKKNRGVVHFVAVGSDSDRVRERVDCDPDGQVRRIERIYNREIWPDLAADRVVMSLLPARAVGTVSFNTLGEFRSTLAGNGLLSRDEAVLCDVVDLSEPHGLLSVHEHLLTQGMESGGALGFVETIPAVYVGEGARIDPSARFIEPVLVYPGAIVEEGVTIIGPTVIGSDSTVQRRAVVAQSLLAGESMIPAEATVRAEIVTGIRSPKDMNGADAADTVPPIEDDPFMLGGFDGRFDDGFDSGFWDGFDKFRKKQPGRAEHRSLNKQAHRTWKRVLDIVASVTGLVIFSPIMILLVIIIKLESPGAVLFAHRREKRGGAEFSCWKFRTMIPDADRLQQQLTRENQVDGPQFKMENDPRVTRVGRFLRFSNLDELPQLFNVLWGQMSLVGPRPSPFCENQICVPWRKARLSVRPGITGLWQVCRHNRSESDFNQWIHYDILYVRHFSFWLDLKILGATALTLGGKWSIPIQWMIPASRTSRPVPHAKASALGGYA